MRLGNVIRWDMKLQKKYGFYLLYSFLTVFYLIILFSLPEAWRSKAVSFLIFSDPAAMGLFFMGAVVLLEKSQKIPCAFAVSPLRAAEYIISKVVSMGIIGMAAAALLAVAGDVSNLLYALAGTALASVVFTLSGMIAAANISSLNQFILFTVPVEILGFVPAGLHLFYQSPAGFHHYPANVCMDLIAGNSFSVVGLLCTVLLIAVLFAAAQRCVLKMWESAGGVKL